MKVLIRFFIILTFLTICFLTSAQTQTPQKIFIAVLDFDARTGVGQGEAASLSDIFSSQLAQTGQYIIVDRNRIKTILNEQGFQQSEACSSVECVVEVGKILNVQKIFAGVIGKIGRLYTVNVQLINVTTAQIELNKSRRYEGEIEDLATTIIPKIAVEMTKDLTGQDVEVDETVSSSSHYNRHEISLGIGGGPEGKWTVFNRPAEEVHLKPKNVFHIAYQYQIGPYVAFGLRFTSFKQKIENYPVYPLLAGQTLQQTLTINNNTVSFQGKINFVRSSIVPYGTISLGYAFGNIDGIGNNGSLSQQSFDGPAVGFGLGSNFFLTNHAGITIDFRILGISAGYSTEKQPEAYNFNGYKFDGSYNAAFLILFFQF
jgi:TolB-like protein